MSREQGEQADRRRAIIRDLRSGKKVKPERWEGLTYRQRQNIERKAKKTALQSSFSKLSFDEALSVFTVANDKERQELWPTLIEKRSRADNPDPVTMAAYYQLKLDAGQKRARTAGEINALRTIAYRLADPKTPDGRVAELLRDLKANPQYEADPQFVVAAFRHRWMYSDTGKRSGRRVGTDAYWARVRQLLTILREQ